MGIIIGKAKKQAWLRGLEEINQTIQAKNAELRKLLAVSEDEKQRLQQLLHELRGEQVGESSSAKSPHKTENEEICTFCPHLEDYLLEISSASQTWYRISYKFFL